MPVLPTAKSGGKQQNRQKCTMLKTRKRRGRAIFAGARFIALDHLFIEARTGRPLPHVTPARTPAIPCQGRPRSHVWNFYIARPARLDYNNWFWK